MPTFGQNFKEGLSSLGSSLPSAGLGLITSSVGSLIGGAINNKFQKKLMKQQQKYNIENYNREVQRQDYLLANGPAIQKASLQNAGISAATIAGGYNPISTGPAISGVTGGSANANDILNGVTSMLNPVSSAQARAVNAAAEKTETENKLLNKQLGNYDRQFAAEQDKREADSALSWMKVDLSRLDKEFAERSMPDRLFSVKNEATLSLSRVAKTVQEISNLRATEELTNAQASVEREKVGLIKSQISEAYANTRKLIQDAMTSSWVAQQYKDQHELQTYRKMLSKLEVQSKDMENRFKVLDLSAFEKPTTFNVNGISLTATGAQLKYIQQAQQIVTGFMSGNASMINAQNSIWDIARRFVDDFHEVQGIPDPVRSK